MPVRRNAPKGGNADRPPQGLTPFQIEVARAFFEIPESAGFLLAGGAALVAQGLSDRPTQDLDFFTSPAGGDVTSARAGLQQKAEKLGWSCSVIRDHATFCRLILTSDGREVLVDLAVDSRPEQPPTVSFLGPTFSLEELAARKTIALFDRAEARDFADVFVLAARFNREDLLTWASSVDAGFDREVFVQMVATLARFADDDLPVPDGQAPAVRAFFAQWAADLRAE